MSRQIDICCLGEVLIDLTQTGVNSLGVPVFAANPGGAPANVAVAASRLGASTAFCGCVGDDSFGHYLKKVLEENIVDASALVINNSAPTTLAAVSVDDTGERSFQFYRHGSADTRLSVADIPEKLIRNAKILHFGSLALTAEPSKSAQLKAIEIARRAGVLTSYDPNYRAALWESETVAKEAMRQLIPMADIIKVSDNELELLTDETDIKKAAQKLLSLGAQLVFITCGSKLSYFANANTEGFVDTLKVKLADTNGAGDTFVGAALSKLAGIQKEALKNLTQAELEDITHLANHAAALTCTRSGAIPAMPYIEELNA